MACLAALLAAPGAWCNGPDVASGMEEAA